MSDTRAMLLSEARQAVKASLREKEEAQRNVERLERELAEARQRYERAERVLQQNLGYVREYSQS